MKKLVMFVFLLVLVIPLVAAGCGAGFVGSNPPPPPKTVSSVTVTCAPTTLQLVASGSQRTSQCTWTVKYSDGTTDAAATIAASPSSAGSISSTGVFTPSTSITVPMPVTVTATSTGTPITTGTTTITVNPAVKITVSAQSATVVSGGTDQFTANVVNTSDTSVTWTTSAGTISSTGLLTAPTVTANTPVTVTATSKADPTAFGTATITVNPVPVAPTITLSASAATVAFGGNASFTFQTTGIPSPTATCKVTGTGACSVSGTTVSYTVPNLASAPASFVDTLTVTAQNSAGTASATTTINLVASITSATVHGSVDPQAAFCARYNCGVSVDMVGTGFFANSGFLQDLVAPVGGIVNAAFTVTDSSHVTMTALVGKGDFRPKPWHIGVRQPGPCCGFDSNVVNFVFLGNLDTMDISTTDAFQFNKPGGVVQKFKLADGSPDGNFGASPLNVAVDDLKGYFVYSQFDGFIFVDANGSLFSGGGGGNGQAALAVSAKGGYMCGSQDTAGQIVSLQLVPNNGTLVPLIVGDTPWQTAMLTLNNQPVCTVFNVGDLKFTVAPIPIPSVNPAPLWTLTLQGIIPLSQVPEGARGSGNFAPNGGWPLVVSQSASKAAILSRFDRKVAIIDLLAKKQQMVSGSPTVDLTPNLGGAIILRMAVDNTHQKAVISLAQTAKETSTFISVDLNTGAVSPMNAKTSFYATDLRVSVDGTILYCGDSAGQFLKVPNQ